MSKERSSEVSASIEVLQIQNDVSISHSIKFPKFRRKKGMR